MQRKIFKDYYQDQSMLLPPSLDELIDLRHPVRIVNQIVEEVDLSNLYEDYLGGGAPSYDPRMMLKVLVWSYINNEYSSRRIERACKEQVSYMWLAAMSRPDHNTINTFRTHRLGEHLKKIFTEIVKLLNQAGVLSFDVVMYDGTKIEANANRHKVVWAKGVETNKTKLALKIDKIWEQARAVAEQELEQKEPTSLDQVNPESIAQVVERINAALKDKPIDKKVARDLRKASREAVDQAKKYQRQEEILAGRGSYSVTDQDASSLRSKEDQLAGSPKPNYNVEISTNNQYILSYSIHQSPSDTGTLKPHFDAFEQYYNTLPKTLVADAAYGSQDNYSYLEVRQVEALVKYNVFDKEKKNKFQQENPFRQDTLHYNAEGNYYVCPIGQHMKQIAVTMETSASGMTKEMSHYQSPNCTDCPLRGPCFKADGNRVIRVSHEWQRLRKKAQAKLISPDGHQIYKQRSTDIEPVFGDIKANKKFRRFLLRSLIKVDIEFGLVALGHNMKKYINRVTSLQPGIYHPTLSS